ncbi:type III pantothenate kinase [Draconibacterium sp. IB214405]|uniref:type III pantothenate kinase n=1 Tax=Draconibacterium sp. IB214405 TaxID=3097352 RepID=UPI002A10152D|nr:type III pantothenate kinase [Draconibacterium sp. IB214405]MDX8338243.1 type III pantothenate kinase [Draconibacterium sp. IB214405]
MNLVIDIGNTRTKYSVCNRDEVLDTFSVDEFLPSIIKELKKEYTGLDKAILSSVTNYSAELKNALSNEFKTFVELGPATALPIENCYHTKDTLGKDRIAAVVGAYHLYSGFNVLVIDAGTAITFDLLTAEGKYLGGNISPGLEMRYKALNQFTGKLPKVEKGELKELIGKTTEQAIRAGVQHGIVFEVDGAIASFKEIYDNLKVIITGGDAEFFDYKLKNSFFVHFNLTSLGLNRILQHNGEKK